MQVASFVINIHGVGKVTRAYEPGEELYWIDAADLERVLDFVERCPRRESVRLTFDDGNHSDHAIAAPELLRRGLHASFFVLAGRLDLAGYLSRSQVRELHKAGFEIGSHGVDHIDWTRANDEALKRELKDSKAIIEDITGCAVQCAAIPFGLYDRRVLEALSCSGYREVFSSDGGPRLIGALPIPRYSLRGDVDVGALANRIRLGTTLLSRVQTEARVRIKASIRQRSDHATVR